MHRALMKAIRAAALLKSKTTNPSEKANAKSALQIEKVKESQQSKLDSPKVD